MRLQAAIMYAYGTSEGAVKGWDMRGRSPREVAKKLGLPGGKGLQKWGDDYYWSKRGGHYDAWKVHDKLLKAGFVLRDKSSTIGQPDTIAHGKTYDHPHGFTANIHQSYGGTSWDNSHTITLKKSQQ